MNEFSGKKISKFFYRWIHSKKIRQFVTVNFIEKKFDIFSENSKKNFLLQNKRRVKGRGGDSTIFPGKSDMTRDPNIRSSIKAFGSRFWSRSKKGWSSFDRAVKKRTSFQSGVWFDLMLKKKWSVSNLWSSFKNFIWAL